MRPTKCLEPTHYGIVSRGTLVSIAATYVSLPQVKILGGIYTRKSHRGKGYGTAVVEAATRDILSSGTQAGLHVEVENGITIHVYKKLGYHVIARRTWLYAYP